MRLSEVIPSLDFILWDNGTRRIISIAEHRQRADQPGAA
jgi:hypothetical protein